MDVLRCLPVSVCMCLYLYKSVPKWTNPAYRRPLTATVTSAIREMNLAHARSVSGPNPVDILVHAVAKPRHWHCFSRIGSPFRLPAWPAKRSLFLEKELPPGVAEEDNGRLSRCSAN